MAERVFRAGPLGHGHAMKALNNFVACAGEIAALDAMMIGARFGLDVETMLDVFRMIDNQGKLSGDGLLRLSITEATRIGAFNFVNWVKVFSFVSSTETTRSIGNWRFLATCFSRFKFA